MREKGEKQRRSDRRGTQDQGKGNKVRIRIKKKVLNSPGKRLSGGRAKKKGLS